MIAFGLCAAFPYSDPKAEPEILRGEMVRAAFAGFAFAVAILGQGTLARGEQDRWPAAIIVAQAQTSAAEERPQPAAAPAQPTAPNAAAPSTLPEPMQLPPITIIQSPGIPAKKNIRARKPAARVAPAPPLEAPNETAGQTVAMTPVKGSEIPLEKVPGGVSQVSSADIQRSGSPAIEDALQQNVPGVIISDVNGNPFATDVQYRGFTSSPVEGTPQGLAVYQNGVRINEVFGDTVNWDLIPSPAINSITVVSGNPLYGLNALGGAVNISMKDGFSFQGAESDTRAGSYGRFQESLQFGKQVDNFAAYVAVEGIWDEGWREFSPSEVRRTYMDLGVKDKDTEFHINFTGAETALGAVGPAPVQLVAQDYNAVFTSPQTTDNQLAMLSVNGSTKLTETLSLSGVAYLRSFHQSHVDGNVSNVAPCNLLNGGTGYDPGGLLCLQTSTGAIVPVTDQLGNTIPTGKYYGPNATIGEIDYTTNNANSYGGSLQATSKDTLFGYKNLFIAGASVDHGDVKSTSDAELGTLNTQNLVVTGNGLYVASPLDLAPADLKTATNYYGLFFADTLDVTKALSVTAGGRYNYEELLLNDLTGTTLTGGHLYTRFNPMAGLTYKFNSSVSAYGGYAEANRAPTPAELSCADPAQPCLLQNFLVSDPNLKQVVSKTWQGGFRGNFSPFGFGHLDWTAGVFHTEDIDDILNVTDPVIRTRGYFTNAGNSLREGVEAGLKYRLEHFTFNANYAYVNAIFLSNLTIPSPNNPFADTGGNIFVHPGDHIPTIPPQRLKAGFDYDLTDAWKLGADVVLASSQYYFGDESNQNPKLPGYGVINLRTSYEVTNGVTLYGLINNLFDHKYATYGAFYDTQIQNVSGNLSTSLTNADMITPAQPFSVYGGVRVRF
jgi:outer membrane receptor protein involved in Fe transport